jgi:glycosyltransferase involved in cell wall biosynthesis
MTPAPLVSIIIPCYNAARWLGEALRGAQEQTHPNKEIIVVDDGSDDETAAVVASMGGPVRYERVPHAGAAAARNRGLALAAGELIQFLDADDEIFPDKIRLQTELLNKGTADLVFCNGERTAAWTGRRNLFYGEKTELGDPLLFALQHQIPILAPLHRRARLLAAGGFREELPCSQERDLNIRLACAALAFHYHPDVLFRVRRLPESLSSNYVAVLDQHLDIARRAAETLRGRGTLTDPRARALAEFLARDARHYFQRGRPQQGRDYLRAARALHSGGGLAVYGPLARGLLPFVGPEWIEKFSGFRRSSLSQAEPS